MHVHCAFAIGSGRTRTSFAALYRQRVTGVRDMGGDLPVLFAWRKQIAAGQIVGPRMVISGRCWTRFADGKLRFPSSMPVTTPRAPSPLSIL